MSDQPQQTITDLTAVVSERFSGIEGAVEDSVVLVEMGSDAQLIASSSSDKLGIDAVYINLSSLIEWLKANRLSFLETHGLAVK